MRPKFSRWQRSSNRRRAGERSCFRTAERAAITVIPEGLVPPGPSTTAKSAGLKSPWWPKVAATQTFSWVQPKYAKNGLKEFSYFFDDGETSKGGPPPLLTW